MIEHRDLARERTEDFVEAPVGPATAIQDEVSRLTRRVGEDVDETGLADTALAVNDDVQPLLLDGGDELGKGVMPPGKAVAGNHRLRRAKRIAQCDAGPCEDRLAAAAIDIVGRHR